MSTANLTQQSTIKSTTSVFKLITRVGSMLLESSVPFMAYMLTKSIFHTSDIAALSVGIVIPVIFSAIRFARSRSIDIMGLIIVVSMVGSIAAALVGGSPQLLLIRESIVGAFLGIALLVSLLWPRSLFFYIMRHFRTGNDQEKIAAFN